MNLWVFPALDLQGGIWILTVIGMRGPMSGVQIYLEFH